MRNYTKASHTVYHHRYHLVWITKYRYKVLQGDVQSRAREIISQVADELNIKIVNGVVSSDHVHIYCSIPPHTAVSDFVKKAKGKKFTETTKRTPAVKKKVLGTTFLGKGLL